MTKIIFIFILVCIINSNASNLPAACLNSFKRAALEANNAYRTLHRVPLLVLDDSDNEAQNYAQKLANNNQGLKHSSNRIDKGENLYAKFTSQRLFDHDFCFGIKKYSYFNLRIMKKRDLFSLWFILFKRNGKRMCEKMVQ